MVLVDVSVYLEHGKLIRSNIGPESVEKCRDVQNEPISGNFRKKAQGIPLGRFFQTQLYFLQIEDSILKTLYNFYILNRLESIQIRFFCILINIKHSSYDRISKSQNNLLFIKQWSTYLQK
jgi:hypothetical protein